MKFFIITFAFLFPLAVQEIKIPNIVTDAHEYAVKKAKQYNINPTIATSIINTESKWNHKALGDKGRSFGLMQVKCTTAREFGFTGKCTELLNYKNNIDYGMMYLNSRIKKYGQINGIAAYNSGKPRYRNGKLINNFYVKQVMKYVKS